MIKAIKESSLGTRVFVAMVLGALAGFTIGQPMTDYGFIGTIWLNCVKMLIAPMVFVVLITGVTSQKDIASLGRVAIRIVLYFVLTTALATVVGIATASVLKPGTFAVLEGLQTADISKSMGAKIDMSPKGFLLGLFSSNIFRTFYDANILQLIVVAILVGIAIVRVKDQNRRTKLIDAFDSLSDLIFSLIGLVMKATPIGVFFLMGESFGKYGFNVFISMASLLGTYYLSCVIHVLLIYGSILWIVSKINPLRFIKDSMEVWVTTISTCSSAATIPVSLKVAREKFNVPDRISSFTIPLGATINYDGGALLYGCLILYISQMIGAPVSLGMIVQVVILASVISSGGGGGAPGGGIFKVILMVEAFGLPVEICGIVAAFWRLFEMAATTNNCLGDLVGTVFVSRLEDRREARNAKKAGLLEEKNDLSVMEESEGVVAK